ncbi:MAG: hypothetical protein E7399_02405 [Ruminococcaceae bacterium]|nr:hypothetical protein [Oscillospiraceae bacterium]
MKKLFQMEICFLLIIFMICIAGCGNGENVGQSQEEQSSVSSIFVYTLNHDRDYISRMVREFPVSEDINVLVIEQMMEANEDLFPRKTELLSVSVDGSAATVDFSAEIAGIDQETFLFINELCAISLAQGVAVQGEKISTMTLLADGQPISGFYQYPYQVHLVDYAAEENLNVDVLKLYYPDQNGEKLHAEYRLVPLIEELDKTMIYELFAGTEDYSNKTNVIPTGTEFLNLSSTGNTYTIDLNAAFLDNRQPETTTNLMAIQSIVATLTEFTVIDQVKFNIEGQTSGMMFGEISLDQPIPLNTELIAE